MSVPPPIFRSEKPKRSLNVYNIYFKLERERLLGNIPDDSPEKKIGFKNLAQTVSRNWKSISIEYKNHCLELSRQDKIRFQREMKEYKETKAYLEQQERLKTTFDPLPMDFRRGDDTEPIDSQDDSDESMMPPSCVSSSMFQPIPSVQQYRTDTIADLEPIDDVTELVKKLDPASRDFLIRALL